jgi:CRISPR-associated endoribonuclease Cas6/Csy4 subtype I-F
MDDLFFVRVGIPSDMESGIDSGPDMIVINQLFTRIHRAAKGSTYALSFPSLTEETDSEKASFGKSLLIFCEFKNDLIKILDSIQVRRLLRDHCEVTPVRPVPNNLILGWEAYVRDRTSDKTSPSAIRRAKARIASGKCNENRSTDFIQSNDKNKRTGLPYFNHLSISSAQEGESARNVKVHVRKITTTKPASFNFDSFGLSSQGLINSGADIRHNGAVPILRSLTRN